MRKPVDQMKVGPSGWAVVLLWTATAFTVTAAVLLSGEFSPFW